MRQKRILKDVVVDGMALTGSPANGEPFLLMKSADGDKWPEDVEMVDGSQRTSAPASTSNRAPQIKNAPTAIAKSIEQVAIEKGVSADDAVMLQSIGHLIHSVDGITPDMLMDIAKAAGVETLEKKGKMPPQLARAQGKDEDEDEEEQYDEEDEDESDDDGDEDEDEDDVEAGRAEGTHPSLPPFINRKANARAKAKQGLKKGGPGSGRYPAGSHGNDSDGPSGDKKSDDANKAWRNGSTSSKGGDFISREALQEGSKGVARERSVQASHAASRKAESSGSKSDHEKASKAHEKARDAHFAAAKSAATGGSTERKHLAEGAKHAQAAKYHEFMRQNIAAGTLKKSQLVDDMSTQQGGATMPESIDKSAERVDLTKAHRELLEKHEEMVSRLEKTEKELFEQRDAALLKSVQEEVQRDFGHLAVNRNELAGIIKHAREQTDQTHHDAMMKILKSLNNQVKFSGGSNLFKSSTHAPSLSMEPSDSPRARFNARLESRIAKSTDSKKSRHDHFLDEVATPEGRADWNESLQGGR